MAGICRSVIHLCRVRATRLDSTGAPTPGPNNAYVTDKPISLAVTPVIEAGQDLTLVGGCDCIVAAYRGYDKLKRFDFSLALGTLEPEMMELMLGASLITQGGAGAGAWWPVNQFSCVTPAQPLVAFEGWQDAWVDDHQSSAPFRYVHWVWPASRWQIAAHTLENAFMQPSISGFSQGNTNWGLGIYGDYPEAAQALGGFFYTNTLPTPFCDYVTEGLT